MNPFARVDYAHTARQYSAISLHYQDWATLPWREIVSLQGKHLHGRFQKHGLASSSRVLSLACGKGTQIFGLAGFGYDCTGIDLSDALIEQARALAPTFDNGQSVQFICDDILKAKDLLHDAPPFDAVTCFGNSLALLGSLDNIRICLNGAASLMRSGGLLVLTGMDYTAYRDSRPHIIQHGPITIDREGSWVETAEWMDDGTQYVSYVTFTYTRPQYDVKHYPFTLLYALTEVELRSCLSAAGFDDIAIETRQHGDSTNLYVCTARKK